MRKFLLLILVIPFINSCNTLKTGLYKHEICGKGPDCFMYDFCNNGRFTFWYSQDVVGSATLIGSWRTSNDTLYIKPDKFLFETETSIINRNKSNSDSLIIRIRLLPQYFKEKRDTTYLDWLIMLNDNKTTYETDPNGVLRLKHEPVNKVIVRDMATKFGYKPLIQIKDTVFTIDQPSNEIDVFIANNDMKPLVLAGNDKFLIKGRKLISVLENSDSLMSPSKYIRIRRKCGNIKNE